MKINNNTTVPASRLPEVINIGSLLFINEVPHLLATAHDGTYLFSLVSGNRWDDRPLSSFNGVKLSDLLTITKNHCVTLLNNAELTIEGERVNVK